jgi:hypothetical protein
MKYKKQIIILLVIVVVGVVGFYLYRYIAKMIRLKKEMELWNEQEKEDAIMRDKYETIKNVDEFIESVKYAKNKKVYGYDLTKLEPIKDKIKDYDIDYLQDIRDYIYEGLGELSEDEMDKVLKFFQKLYK